MHQFAKDIQLQLRCSGIPGTYRTRVLVSRDVAKFFLVVGNLAEDGVERVEGPRTGSAVVHKLEEIERFAREFEAKQGDCRECGITQPCKAIVPIKLVADP